MGSGVSWEADPSVVVGIFVACFAYTYLARQYPPTRLQISFFAGAVLAVVLALASPLHVLSEQYLFTAHMAQHVLLIMVMPPLLLASVRPEMARTVVRAGPVSRFLTRTLIAWFSCNLIFAISHVPSVYDALLRSHSLHIGSHLAFMATGILLWWPIMSPLPELPRIPYAAQLLYIFLQVLPGAIIGGLIANTERILYQVYADAPRVFDLTPIQDHQLGSIVMWVGGGTFFLLAFTVVFFRWAARDMAEVRAARPHA